MGHAHAGDEEVQYVYLELPTNLPAGTKLAIEVSSTPAGGWLAAGMAHAPHGTATTHCSAWCLYPVLLCPFERWDRHLGARPTATPNAKHTPCAHCMPPRTLIRISHVSILKMGASL